MTPARKQGTQASGSRTGGARRRSRPGSAAPRGPEHSGIHEVDLEDAEAAVEADEPRRGAKRTVMDVVMQLPNYLRMLFGLVTDKRVQTLDKLLVVGAVAYILSPLDFVPDFIPFFGQVDDAFLLIASIERLISNAGRRVVLAHWHGDPADLSRANLRTALMAASFFLPRRIRRRLRGMVT